MNEGDYINVPDMGKLYESSATAVRLADQRGRHLHVSQETEPEEFNAIYKARISEGSRVYAEVMDDFAKAHNINPDNVVLFEANMFAVAMEHEDVADDIKRLMTKVLMFADSKQTGIQRGQIHRIRVNYDEKRNRVIRDNTERREKAERNNLAYSKVIRQNDIAVEARRAKMIKSMNKALERAGNPTELSSSDYDIYRMFHAWDWVGHDGSRFCCKEQVILAEPLSEFVEKIWQVLQTVKNNKEKAG